MYDNALYLTVDIVVMATRQDQPHVLLIRRAHTSDAYPGHWALPGGYVDQGERVTDAAHRELAEETGIHPPPLQQFGIYDEPGRDPRDRVVSIAYTTTLPYPLTPHAGDDAIEARWTPVADVLAGAVALAFDHARIIADAHQAVTR